MAKSVVVNFIGDASRMKKAADESTSALDRFQNKVSAAGKRLTAFVSVPIALALGKATKAANEERKEVALLEQQIKANTGATSVNMKATERWVTSLQNASGFVDSEVRKSYGMFVNVLKDQAKAQGAAAFAADFARSKNISLEEATSALMGAETGRVKALVKLGVETKNADGSTKSLTQIINENRSSVQGAAKAYAEGAGKSEVMSHKMADLSEAIGGVLLPVMDMLTGAVQKVTGWFESLTDGQKKMVVTVALVVAAVGPALMIFAKLITIVKAARAVMVFFAANPVVLALTAIIAAVVLTIKHWDKIKAATKAVWEFIKQVTKDAVNFLIGVIERWLHAMLVPLRILGEIPGVPGRGKIKELARTKLPRFDDGGIMPGPRGAPGLAVLHGGETVVPTHKGGSVGGITVHVHGSVVTDRQLVQVIREAQLQTGRRNARLGLV